MTHGAGTIRALLDEHGITPSRALGQNFVIDPNTVRRIALLAGVTPGEPVLEIGPGLGSLSLALAELGSPVVAVEIDRHLAPVVRAVVADAGADVTVIEADALEIDWPETLRSAPSWRLAANLPYNVGTTILLRLLETAPMVSGGIVLVQREVAERLAARPGDDGYGIPSAKAAWWAETKVVGKVSASVFHPRPRVESALVSFERRNPPGDETMRRAVFALIDAGFGQRRKMLRRSLSAQRSVAEIEAADVAPTARAEDLSLDDWCALVRGRPS